jgi:hypothetical protein
MLLLTSNIKRLFFQTSLLVSLLLVFNCKAALCQSGEPLSDSVKAVEDTVASSISAETDSSKNDIVIPQEATIMRSVPDSTVNSLKRDKSFEYANDDAYLAKEPENQKKGFFDFLFRLLTSRGAVMIIYILMASVLLFALYKIIVDNKLYLFYSKPKRLEAVENIEENISSENIDEKIKEAIQAKNYRLAIRYMHLKALQNLDQKNFIRFHAQGTNLEYASQLKSTPFANDFQYLTNIYEYVWFGGFELTEQQAVIVQQNFNQFYTSIRS